MNVLLFDNDPKTVLNGLLTRTGAQARNVGFNISFNNLQNTIIDRLNADITKIANVDGNQRELDSLGRTFDKLGERRSGIIEFAFTNQSNKDRFSEISTLTTSTIFNFSLGDSDTENISASEVTELEAAQIEILALADRMIELSHPDFVDGNNVTRLRSLVEDLTNLTATEGVLDDEGTSPATNENREILDVLSEITLVAGAAADTSLTLQFASTQLVLDIDDKLTSVNAEINTINSVRAIEIEFEIQSLRIKNATFLRSIELAFDTTAQGLDGLTHALDTNKEPDLGSIISILT